MNIDLEDILLDKHPISYVREGSCCYGEDVVCRCGWEGSPSDYSTHLVVTLGFTRTVVDKWKQRLGQYAMIDDRGEENFLNTYRGEEDKTTLGLSKKEWEALDKTERKESKKAGKLVRTGPFADDPSKKNKWDYMFEEPPEF
jgi:hypothetical protein